MSVAKPRFSDWYSAEKIGRLPVDRRKWLARPLLFSAVLNVRSPEPYFLPCYAPCTMTGGYYQLVHTFTDTSSTLMLDTIERRSDLSGFRG